MVAVKKRQNHFAWNLEVRWNYCSSCYRLPSTNFTWPIFKYFVPFLKRLTVDKVETKSTLQKFSLKTLQLVWVNPHITEGLHTVFFFYSSQLTFTFSIKETLKKQCEICLKLTIKHQNDVLDVVLVFLLLTLNIFHNFFYSFCHWFWISKC